MAILWWSIAGIGFATLVYVGWVEISPRMIDSEQDK